jgi:hypothetical protein
MGQIGDDPLIRRQAGCRASRHPRSLMPQERTMTYTDPHGSTIGPPCLGFKHQRCQRRRNPHHDNVEWWREEPTGKIFRFRDRHPISPPSSRLARRLPPSTKAPGRTPRDCWHGRERCDEPAVATSARARSRPRPNPLNPSSQYNRSSPAPASAGAFLLEPTP